MRKPLGKLDAAAFMRRFWQREPLLVRGAFPRFEDPLSVEEVLALARSRDAESRLVRREGRRWTLEHGPFSSAKLKQLPGRAWTVLVQDTNHFSERCARLLQRFDFVPHARVDDLMVSYAVPGGGVGPHVDSYDVFLLQGKGRRRWRISRSTDHALVPGLPLKILRRFSADAEWVLEAGDVLYLPPGVAHHGVAESECLTWSIGFRAPSNAEVIRAFLDFLHDRVDDEERYADPGAAPARRPGQVPRRLVEHVERTLAGIRWSARDVRDFTGRLLSEPEPHVFFAPPPRPAPFGRFVARAARRGIALDRRSRLLFSGSMFYMNGEAVRADRASARLLARLADGRRLAPPIEGPRAFWERVHAWHAEGFVHAADEGDA